MDYKYKQLEQELSALSKLFGELAGRLSEVAKELTVPGVIPPEKLIEQLAAARASFDTVRGAVHGHASAMLVAPLPKLVEIASIAAADTLLKAAAAAEEAKYSAEGERERALGILSRVLAITHRETAEFKPLQDCHAAVSELKNAVGKVVWPQRHPESESIIALKHPATALLTFVENLDTLEDERWMALEALITESYGKSLFVAASRGKLTVQPAAPKAATAPAEKPAEKKAPTPVAEKPAAEKPGAEKKEAVQAQPKTVPVVIPGPVNSAPAPAPAAVAQAPAAAAATVTPAPVAATTSSAPAPAAPQVAAAPPVTAPAAPRPVPTPVVATQPAPPAQAAQATATIHSLSALATATEPPVERKHSVVAQPAPDSGGERQRKEPRLAVPAPQSAVKNEIKPVEQPLGANDAPSGMAGDGSQRPQRWGFWRGNR